MREKVQIKNQRYTKYNHGINRGTNLGQTKPERPRGKHLLVAITG